MHRDTTFTITFLHPHPQGTCPNGGVSITDENQQNTLFICNDQAPALGYWSRLGGDSDSAPQQLSEPSSAYVRLCVANTTGTTWIGLSVVANNTTAALGAVGPNSKVDQTIPGNATTLMFSPTAIGSASMYRAQSFAPPFARSYTASFAPDGGVVFTASAENLCVT